MISAVPKVENILIVIICPYTVLNFSTFGFPHQSERKFNSPSLPVYSPFHQKYCLKLERGLIICPFQTPVGLPCDQHSAASNKDPFGRPAGRTELHSSCFGGPGKVPKPAPVQCLLNVPECIPILHVTQAHADPADIPTPLCSLARTPRFLHEGFCGVVFFFHFALGLNSAIAPPPPHTPSVFI